ncbi:uncharacterized protein TM35_000043210 [Trypanosoma theileri]|uniref:Uncharacterized protein n=1 Tax=Trypanosoma theileri TaxID=67003 RepID=A0A1X0P594_9TRYP|nr:uncharacterized protein TM35_000043210 [Trypanosoma theileri]ORC92107.1 hypothetical protein TM35_000043210 [Trypanosoma theileri]
MLTSSIDNDEDHFRERLDSINKEMQDIIDRTAIQRDKIFRSSAIRSSPWSLADGQIMGITDSINIPHNFSSTTTTTAAATAADVVVAAAAPTQRILDEAALKRIVADEMNKWKSTFQQNLNDTVSNVHSDVDRRFEAVQKSQLELAESLKEAVEASQRSIKEVQTVLTQMQRTSGRTVEDLARELDKYVRKNSLEQTRLCDAVAALENESRIDQQRGDRRVDELVRRHHDLVRNSLLQLDAHVDGLRDELQSTLRVQARQAAEESDLLHQQVSRVQGSLEATNDTVARWVAELRTLMEENITRRSEVRSCRRDFNRLEMLLQCLPVTDGNNSGGIRISKEKGNGTQGDIMNISNGGGGGGGRGGGVSREGFMALNEKVDFLSTNMQKMEKQIVMMDTALRSLFARGGAAAAAGNNASYLSQSHSGMMEGRSYRPSPLDTRSFHTTDPSQLSQDVSPMSMGSQHQQQQQMRMMMQNRSSLGPGVMARAHGGLSPMSSSTPSPMSATTRLGNAPSFDPRKQNHHYQQQQQHPHHQYQHQQHQHHYHQMLLQQQQQQQRQQEEEEKRRASLMGAGSRSRHVSGEWGSPADRSGPSSRRFPQRMEDVMHSQQREVPHASESTASEGATKGPTSQKSDSDVRSHVPTPSDSYVTDADVNERDEDTSMQYVPAPSSDVESELENKKLARLALD